MSPHTPTQLADDLFKLEDCVRGQVRARTPVGVIAVIAQQMQRAEQARVRVNEEGIVVRDLKGGVIPHPAIKIENDASKIVADLLSKNR